MDDLKRFSFPRQQIFLLMSICLTTLVGWQIHTHLGSVDLFALTLCKKEQSYLWILFLSTATCVNWGLEICKWHLLVSKTTNSHFGKSASAVLGGLVIGLVTPARLGEIPGRTLFYAREFRVFLLSGSFFASLAQNFWNVLAGLLALWFLSNHFDGMFLSKISIWLLVGIGFVAVGIAVTILFYQVQLKRIAFFARMIHSVKESILISIRGDSGKSCVWVILLSGLRYFVYLGQYMVIMLLLVPGIDGWHIAAICSLQLMIQTMLPVPAVLSLPTRVQLAIVCWSMLQINAGTAFLATSVLWVLNLGLPGLLGAITLFLKKTSVVEKTSNIHTIYFPKLSSEHGILRK